MGLVYLSVIDLVAMCLVSESDVYLVAVSLEALVASCDLCG